MANAAHKGQIRKSGEPYIIHQLSVALIVVELGLDIESIVSGLLHDVVEDTKYTLIDIATTFSMEVAQIVDGVTKLDKIAYKVIENQENLKLKHKEDKLSNEILAENYRKMFLAMSKDIRVILIKMSDRLHNMRTLKFMTTEKQKQKAQETLDIYAPLAHRLGISKIRYELEDLSFKYLDMSAYYDLANKVSLKQSERIDYIDSIVDFLTNKLNKTGIKVYVEGRPKHFFSIYKKMVNQKKTLDQIYDIFATRVLTDSVSDCYAIVGVIHQLYMPLPGRFKDYIAMPKSNGYQSLHTTVIGDGGEPFEVQIRTHEMHRMAEYGVAAHWKYKEGNKKGDKDSNNEEAKLVWLRQILEWQKDLTDNEFLTAIKSDLDIYNNHVYCFTPSGQLKILPSGSTPIDFAYFIHSAVGNKMIGARVNGKITTIDYKLQTGDRVEILTSQNSRGPGHNWYKMVKSSQAKTKIRQWFSRQNKEDNILKGKEMLEKEAKRKGYVLADLISDEKVVSLLLSRYSHNDLNGLYSSIGQDSISEKQVLNRLIDKYVKRVDKKPNIEIVKTTKKSYAKKSGIEVKGIGDVSVRF